MVCEKRLVVPRRSATFQIFPITNSRLSASLVVNCINFLFENFWFIIFFRKNPHWRKKFTRSILCNFGSSTAKFFFLANIPYSNCPIISSDEKRDRRCLQALIDLLHGSPQLHCNIFCQLETSSRRFCDCNKMFRSLAVSTSKGIIINNLISCHRKYITYGIGSFHFTWKKNSKVFRGQL